MESVHANNETPFVQKEIKKIHEKVEPLMKKNMIFTFISFPLITMSVFNLYLLLFQTSSSENITTPVLMFSIATAIGMALFKETRHNNKEIQKRSIAYIIKKVNTSEHINDYSKKHYLQQLRQEPGQAMEIFFEFLNQEEQNSK